MKVVLFCGGQGTRLREYSEMIPKPMVPAGNKPIIWNVMSYYAYYGFKDFILCLGYKGDAIKEYFVNYREYMTNDFILSKGGKKIDYIHRESDMHDWKITFVDTGLNSNLGMRLLKVKDLLKNEEMFLANYTDGLTDMNLFEMVDNFRKKKNYTAGFLTYKPTQSFHIVRFKDDHKVSSIEHISDSGIWLNVGYFIFRKEIFNFINYGEELVEEPFRRLIENDKLLAYPYSGFWRSMDTFKDKQYLDDLYNEGESPWEVWRKNNKKQYAEPK